MCFVVIILYLRYEKKKIQNSDCDVLKNFKEKEFTVGQHVASRLTTFLFIKITQNIKRFIIRLYDTAGGVHPFPYPQNQKNIY